MQTVKRNSVVTDLLRDVKIPRMFRVKQMFPRPVIKPDEILFISERLC